MKEDNRRLLPPMAMLHAFAAAARAGSFSRAAIRIGLTPGAISRQVGALEDWLGQPLFDRNGRRVVLNEAGRRYAGSVESALTGLRRATREMIEDPERRVVELAVLPSFGMRWLAPRLPLLTALHPGLVVNFTARSDEFAFADEPFDAAIHFGRADWPGVTHDLLFAETTIPVLAPPLAPTNDDPARLLDLPLLVLASRRDAWQQWIAERHVDRVVPPPVASFGHFLMLAQAAVAGAGVALIPEFLIGSELAAGTLIQIGPAMATPGRSYYLVYPPRSERSEGFASLRQWILAQAE